MLWYFIFGILFIQIILPILDSIANLFIVWIEALKSQCSVRITESNCKMQNMAESPEAPVGRIGFINTDYKEEEED